VDDGIHDGILRGRIGARNVRRRCVVSVNAAGARHSVASGRHAGTYSRAPTAPATGASVAPAQRQRDDPPTPPRHGRGRPAKVIPADAIERLRKAGGKANGVRALGKVLGTSKSTAHRLVHRMASAGLVRLDPGRHGVTVALA
jgi:hypothetical protein